MSVAVTISPPYPAAGQQVTLIGTATAGSDEATEWEITSVPAQSRLPLGKLLTRPASMARVKSAVLTYQSEVALAGQAPTILRRQGSFADDGFVAGMTILISGTSSNDKLATVALVEPLRLTLSDVDTLATETATSSISGYFADSAGNAASVFVPDVAGEYGITAYENFVWDGRGGGYTSDPAAAAQRRLLSATSATVHVGEHLDLPIDVESGHGATLRILVVNETVRGADIVEPRTELARMAILDTSVSAAAAAMVGVAVSALDVEFVSDVNELSLNYERHRVLVGAPPVHTSADTTNKVLHEDSHSLPASIEQLNDLSAKVLAHQQATTAGGAWHNADDGKNTLQVARSAKTLAQAIVLKADLRERVFERHRVQVSSPNSHSNPDTSSAMAAPLPLPAAIVAYLDYVAAASVSVPAGEVEGVGDAIAAWGFTRR